MHTIDVRISGVPLATACFYGDVQMNTSWPGGSDELTFSSSDLPATLAVGGALAEGYFGPKRVWYGTLDEPDPSQEQLVAQGLWRLGEAFTAFDGSGNATAVPNTAIDQAIARGLRWTRTASIQSTAVDIDVTQGPVTVAALLDTMAEANGTRWGVDTDGNVYAKADDTTPTYRTFPLNDGLGLSMTDYASTLVGRYLDSGTSTYKTVMVDDPNPKSSVYQEQIVDLTPRGAITTAKATTILTKLFATGVFTPRWTTPISFAYGELLTAGGTAVALETVASGPLIRLPVVDPARSLSGQLFVDVPIGQTSLSDGLLTVQPQQVAPRTFLDVLTRALKRK